MRHEICGVEEKEVIKMERDGITPGRKAWSPLTEDRMRVLSPISPREGL